MVYKKFCSISKAAGTVLLCSAMLAGCTKTASPELPDGEKETVVFGLAGLPEFAVSTKATVPATSVSSFKAAATTGTAGSETAADWNNVVFTTDGAAAPTYMASPAKYWPLSNPCYNFYAVAASEGSAQALATEAPDMSFTAEGAVIGLPAGYDKDVVCAYFPYAENTYLQKNQLAFNHIFARIAGVSVKADDDCAISEVSVSIVDAKTGGEYNLRTGWSNPVPASGNVEIYKRAAAIASGESDAAGSIFNDSDGSLYLVPGSYQLKATWTATIDDYTQTYTAMSSKTALDFVGGKVNTIACKLTGDAEEIVFSVNVRDWTGNDLGNKVFPTEDEDNTFTTLSMLKDAFDFGIDCSGYIGKVIGADGGLYSTVAEATEAGTTASAMIAYVGSVSTIDGYAHGLAIALTDVANTSGDEGTGAMNWSDAITAGSAYSRQRPSSVSNWSLISRNQYQLMVDCSGGGDRYVFHNTIVACGGTNIGSTWTCTERGGDTAWIIRPGWVELFDWTFKDRTYSARSVFAF